MTVNQTQALIYPFDIRSFYRPQRSCHKVMFLHMSVILFTGGTETPLDRDPTGQRLPRQRPPWTEAPTRRTVTNRWYTSYWNVFLFQNVSTKFSYSSLKGLEPAISSVRDQDASRTNKTHVRDRSFKLSSIHASVIYQIR